MARADEGIEADEYDLDEGELDDAGDEHASSNEDEGLQSFSSQHNRDNLQMGECSSSSASLALPANVRSTSTSDLRPRQAERQRRRDAADSSNEEECSDDSSSSDENNSAENDRMRMVKASVNQKLPRSLAKQVLTKQREKGGNKENAWRGNRISSSKSYIVQSAEVLVHGITSSSESLASAMKQMLPEPRNSGANLSQMMPQDRTTRMKLLLLVC